MDVCRGGYSVCAHCEYVPYGLGSICMWPRVNALPRVCALWGLGLTWECFA